MNRIQIIQGGQYGSEAKGAVAAHLCKAERIDYAVRTGATNAGHTVDFNGDMIKMQQLPVGFVNPDTKLVIGPGALVDLAILRREIHLINTIMGGDVRDRLLIDHRATIHLPSAAEASKVSDRHHLIGATGKGCSEALMDRIRLRGRRELRLSRLKEVDDLPFTDTVRLLNREYDAGAKIQLEGTQGTLLDLYTGPWPYTTHKQTLPGVWLSEAGLSPNLPLDIVMVIRTMPIRVAGNSGPLPNETSWLQLAKAINAARRARGMEPIVASSALEAFEQMCYTVAEAYRAKDALPKGSYGTDIHYWTDDQRLYYRDAASEFYKDVLQSLPPAIVAELSKLFELTTVTKKLRRIAHLNVGQLAEAVQMVRPSRTVVTFMNYLYPWLWDYSGPLSTEEGQFIRQIENITRSTVTHINRGAGAQHIIEV